MRPMSGRIAACSIETAAREPQVGRVGRKLIERGIDGQPVASAGALVEVDLGPGVVVERTAHEGQPDGDAGRDPDRARHRHVERGVLVAVADLRPQAPRARTEG